MAHFTSDLTPGFWPYQSAELRALVEDPAHRIEVRHGSGRAATFFLARPTEAVRVGGDEPFLQGVDRIPRSIFDALHGHGEVSSDRFFEVLRAPPTIQPTTATAPPWLPLAGFAFLALVVLVVVR